MRTGYESMSKTTEEPFIGSTPVEDPVRPTYYVRFYFYIPPDLILYFN